MLLLLVAVNALCWYAESSLVKHRAENLLQTGSSANVDAPPTGDLSFGGAPASYWPFIPDARHTRLTILAGMSQLIVINDRQPGDALAVDVMDSELRRRGSHRAFGLTAPNMANEEALFLLLATAARPETTPTNFVFGVCFDKFRNVDLRAAYGQFLRGDPVLSNAWRQAIATYGAKYPLATEKMRQTLEAPVALAAEATLDGTLREAIGKVVPLVRLRQELNAELMTQLFTLRNFVLRIKASSKRRMLAARYATNQEFVALMIDLARQKGIEPLFYVNPLNRIAETPYVDEEYRDFKTWLLRLASREKTQVVDLDAVVPDAAWGEVDGEPDFKHFRGEGHRILARALLESFAGAFVP